MSDPEPTTGASRRHRPDADGAEPSANGFRAEPAANARGAVIALGVAAVGTVAFVIGLRAALHRLPPERPAAAAARTLDARAVDSARARRLAPPPPNQPDEYPRLR